jgi:hypothetical protein
LAVIDLSPVYAATRTKANWGEAALPKKTGRNLLGHVDIAGGVS